MASLGDVALRPPPSPGESAKPDHKDIMELRRYHNAAMRQAQSNRPWRRTGRGRDATWLRKSQDRPAETALLVVLDDIGLGLALGRSQALQALELLFLGHPVGGHLGIVGIDAGAGRADKRNRLGLRLVDFDVFLQRMDQLFLEVL